MSLPDLDPNRSAEALFGDIVAYVETANALVAARDTVNLVGLDTSIAALCERIKKMPPEQSKHYASELQHLMLRIEDLQAKMMALQAQVTASLKSLNTQKKAAHAYTKAPSGRVEE